ncbi:CD248 molecule, endosialin a [Betta splendens]|uniref:CD248 molecule, endosialin a n=1 Tax=Betta splendens TaxID=158456 RepID=A0A6P7LQ31_BETSP|nr:CD248 molecule, endosialin a [Betta splendens]
MGSLIVSSAALHLLFMLALLFQASSVLSQDLRETDAVCKANGCFMVYFQRKAFLEAWRSCNEGGGNLATIKNREDAATVASLFSTLDLRYSRTQVQVWIGLQLLPRQCSPTRVLRGFSWTTGDQDTDYTNWLKEDSQSTCFEPRCVTVSYNTQEPKDNLKWLDGPCSVHVDGYLCHYAYKEMCPALWREGVGNVVYTTPFNLQSTLLTHVPFGSVAAVSCPSGTEERQTVLCEAKEDGSVGWSSESPLCSSPTASYDACDLNNGGCEHLCRMEGAYIFCECDNGFQLRDDGQSCELLDVCQEAPCEYECVPLSDSYRCACPEGYMLAPDEHRCLDVDECLQSPCEQVCVNAPGTFECECLEGYQAEDGACEDMDECMDDPCEHACENTPGSYVCHCHLDYSPVPEDLTRCQDTDECQIPEICEQMCVNFEGGYDCHCKEGYELMDDLYSCRKTEEGDDQSFATPLFPWVTHQPRRMWDPMNYDWNPQLSPTDWPQVEDQWFTDPPRVINRKVIWVTSDSQDPDRPTAGAPHEEEDINISTTPPLPTSSSTTPDLYEDAEEETTRALPFISTSTLSEGAWNQWSELTTQKPDQTVSTLMSKDPTNRREVEKIAAIPVEDLRVKENHFMVITLPQASGSPSQPTASPSPLSGDGGSVNVVGPVPHDREQKPTSTWLLVGLLVPICIIIVVMVVLGIVYCTRCTIQPRSKNATDCYHWISGAHDKQGATTPSTGVKAHV